MSKYLGSDEFQKDMKDLETRVKKLRAEYNQYLVGVLKAPPTFSVAMIQKIVRKYAGNRTLKGPQRFRYFNLVAKFNTMMEFYNRRLRDIEKGRQTSFGYVKSDTEAMDTAKEKVKQMQPTPLDKGHILSDVKNQNTTMRHMFSKWNEFASHLDDATNKIDFDKFKKIIVYKTDQLLEAKECKAIKYKMTVVNGKIKIQAKPIK